MANELDLDHTFLVPYYEGELREDKHAWYQKKIDEAVRLLLERTPGLRQRLAAGKVDREFMLDKIANAVLRVVRNPFGMESESEGNYAVKLNNKVASGDIWFPIEDIHDLSDDAAFQPRTVRMGLGGAWEGYRV